MLSLMETKAISNAQLDTQLLVSLRKAVDAVTAKATAPGADEAIAWNDCSANDFKEQLPGSVLMLQDGSFRYVPTNSAFRVASGVQQGVDHDGHARLGAGVRVQTRPRPGRVWG